MFLEMFRIQFGCSVEISGQDQFNLNRVKTFLINLDFYVALVVSSEDGHRDFRLYDSMTLDSM